MSKAEVTPDPAGRGGFALLRVPDAAACLADPKFRLQRQDERAPYLGPQGWQPAEALLAPANAWTDGPDLVLELGPGVVDAVEPGTVAFSLPAGNRNLTLVWPALPPSRRGGQNVFHEVRQPQKSEPAVVKLEKRETSGADGAAPLAEIRLKPEPKPEPKPDLETELDDPAHFQPNAAIAQPDSSQAARYYRFAVKDGDQNAVAPRADLYNRLQQAAAQGDMQAPLTLNDYWP